MCSIERTRCGHRERTTDESFCVVPVDHIGLFIGDKFSQRSLFPAGRVRCQSHQDFEFARYLRGILVPNDPVIDGLSLCIGGQLSKKSVHRGIVKDMHLMPSSQEFLTQVLNHYRVSAHFVGREMG